LALVADGYSSSFISISLGVYIQGESTGKAAQDFAHVTEHEAVLLHVALAHVLGQPGAGGRAGSGIGCSRGFILLVLVVLVLVLLAVIGGVGLIGGLRGFDGRVVIVVAILARRLAVPATDQACQQQQAGCGEQ
jgi:hypothetical protein